MDLFNDFKGYIKNNGYEVDKVSDESIKGVKEDLEIHLFKERYKKNEDYILNVKIKENTRCNISLIAENEGYRLNYKKDNKKIDNITDIIEYVENIIIK